MKTTRLISGHEQQIIDAALNRERIRQSRCYFENGQLRMIHSHEVETYLQVFDTQILAAAQQELQWRTIEKYKEQGETNG